jgi:hypothetical protein
MTRYRFPIRPWTRAEEDRLRAMVVSGATVFEVATELQRTVAALRARSEQLGLSLKQVTVRRRPSLQGSG